MGKRYPRSMTALGWSAFANTYSPSAAAPVATPAVTQSAAPTAQIVATSGSTSQPQAQVTNAGFFTTGPAYGQAAPLTQNGGINFADPGMYAEEDAPTAATAADGSTADGWGLSSWLANLNGAGWLELLAAAAVGIYVIRKL